LLTLLVVLSLVGFPPGSLAQDDPASPAGHPSLGDPVSIVGAEGGEVAVLTISGVTDPFQDFPKGSGPKDGSRYVAVAVTIEVTGAAGWTVDPYDFIVQDALGFAYHPTFYRGPTGTDTFDAYASVGMELAAGRTLSRPLVFEVPHRAEPANLHYEFMKEGTYDEDRHIVSLADLSDGAVVEPVAGEAVAVVDAEGGEVFRITVEGFVDPFEGYAADDQPAPGHRYVGALFTIVNSGQQTLEDPGGGAIFLQEADGSVSTADYVVRDYDDESPDLSEDDRLITLANLSAGFPAADLGTAPALPDVDCGTFAPYFAETHDRFLELDQHYYELYFADEVSAENAAESAEMVRAYADASDGFAAAQAVAVVPAGLEEINTALIAGYEVIAGVMRTAGDAIDAGDYKSMFEGVADPDYRATIEAFSAARDTLDRLATVCGIDTEAP